MSARSICDEVSGVGAELASGDERARALRHAAACRRCRRKLAELADVADELLFMALPTSRRGLRVTAARAPRRVGLARPPVYAPVPGWLARRARYRPPRPGRVTTGERGRAQAPRGASTQRLPRGTSAPIRICSNRPAARPVVRGDARSASDRLQGEPKVGDGRALGPCRRGRSLGAGRIRCPDS